MINLKELKKEELELLNSVVNSIDSQESLNELKNNINILLEEIKENESKKFNVRMTTEYLLENNSINEMEYKILKEYNINNVQDLINFNFNLFDKNTIPSYMLEDFQGIVKYLNFDGYEEKYGKVK